MISSISTSGADAPAVSPSRRDGAELRPVDVGGTLQQVGVGTAVAQGDLLEPLRVRGVGRADHDHGVDHRRHALDRLLAVGGGVADVLLVRPGDVGEPLLEHRDHLRGVVHRERGLGHIGELVGIGRHEGRGLLGGLDETHRPRRQLPHGAGDLGVAGMADQHDLAAAPEMDFGLAMHLGHQRTGRVDGDEIAPARLLRDRLRHAVGGKDDRRCGVGDLVELFDEDRALLAQAVDHVLLWTISWRT